MPYNASLVPDAYKKEGGLQIGFSTDSVLGSMDIPSIPSLQKKKGKW